MATSGTSRDNRSGPLTFAFFALICAAYALVFYVSLKPFAPERARLQIVEGHVGHIQYEGGGKYSTPKLVLLVQAQGRTHRFTQIDFGCCSRGARALQPNDPVSISVEWDSESHSVGTFWAIARSEEVIVSYEQMLRLFHEREGRMMPFVYVPLAMSALLSLVAVVLRRKHGSWRLA